MYRKAATFPLILIFILTGCAVDISRYEVPVPNTVSLNSGDKVGVINFLRENPTHTNLGLFVWENFSKEVNTDWRVRQLLQEKRAATVRTFIEDRDLDAGALFYTDSPEAGASIYYMQKNDIATYGAK